MAREAERLLDGTRWLPEPLRAAAPARVPETASEEGEAVPEFLVGDDEQAGGETRNADPNAIVAE